MKRLHGFVSVVVMMSAVLVLLAGCSSSGGGDDATPTPTPTPTPSASMSLSGTAAVGAPIASATITLKDSAGAVKSVVTGTDGKYTIDTTGMTAPFLLKIPSGTASLYSVATATATGVANVHPFTDLIIRNWYKVQGSDVDTVFGGTGALAAAPTATEINVIEAVIRQFLTPLLQAAGIDPAQFNLITTGFYANNTGFDNVLETTKVTIDASGLVTVTTVDPNTGTVGGTIIVIPISTDISTTTNPIDLAKTGINTMLSNFKDTLNAKKCSCTVGDIQPYLTTDFIDSGKGAAAVLYSVLENMNCYGGGAVTTMNEFIVTTAIAYNDTDKTLAGDIKLTMGDGNIIKDHLIFKNVGGAWFWYGNQKIASFSVFSRIDKNINQTGTSYVKSLDIEIADYNNSIQSVNVSGPGISSTISNYCTTPTNSAPACIDGAYKNFGANIPIPSVGSVYTATITKTDSSTVTYTDTVLLTPGVTEASTDFPDFTFSGTPTHSASVIGTTITAQVYTPSWVTETPAPFVQLWNGTSNIGSVDATWTATPVHGQNNGFTVAIPAIFGGQSVTKAVLAEDANGWQNPGWGKTAVYWYFE